jgi:hypothetical protein
MLGSLRRKRADLCYLAPFGISSLYKSKVESIYILQIKQKTLLTFIFYENKNKINGDH